LSFDRARDIILIRLLGDATVNAHLDNCMANRHLARSVVLQTLFERDFRGAKEIDVDAVFAHNIEEFAPGLDESEFATDLLKGIIDKGKTLDEIIEKAARDWPLAQTPIVDRNALRLGLYELLFSDSSEVPARVAINEAIELAKSFGGERSGKFINGVLGTIYKEMGEPGKDEMPKKKRKKLKKKEDLTEADIAKLPIKKLAGAVVYYMKGDEIMLGMELDVFGRWTLAKGGIEPDEDEEQGVVREIKEELNITVKPVERFGQNEYIAAHPEEGYLRKQVVYFLAEAKDPDSIKIDPNSGGLKEARWFEADAAMELKTYPDIRPLLEKSIAIISKKNSK